MFPSRLAAVVLHERTFYRSSKEITTSNILLSRCVAIILGGPLHKIFDKTVPFDRDSEDGQEQDRFASRGY